MNSVPTVMNSEFQRLVSDSINTPFQSSFFPTNISIYIYYKMPHPITIIALMYTVAAATYLNYVPEEDYEFLVVVLVVLVALVILAIGVDKIWG